MRFNLHLTHWSLMFITLISSCFLFYVVASENAKYVTTKHAKDASVASNDHKPPTLTSTLSSASSTSEPTTTTSSILQTTSDAATAAASDEQYNLEYEILSEGNNVKILPNYKKVKKLVLPQTQAETSPSSTSITTTDTPLPPIDNDIMPDIALSSESPVLPSSSMPSIETNVAVGTEGSIESANNDDDDDLKKSSDTDDSVLIDNNNSDSDNDRNSDINVENKNVFNTIEELNSNENANSNIHSSIELETQNTVVTQQSHQVPDVEQPEGAEQGIKSKHVQDDKAEMANGLPDITDIPTVTVTELPLEVLQPPQNSLDAVIIADGSELSSEERVNRTIEVITDSSKEEIQKDEQIVKLNDSGGGDAIDSTQQSVTNSAPLPTSELAEEQEAPASLTNNIPTETYDINHTQPTMNITLEQQQQQQQQQNTSSTTATDSQVNLTAAAAAAAEEVPMPVFSEWAQKQMEAAEKQQALEQEQTVNNSAQRKNNTNGNGKPAALKLRAKNYASPDCGAKIIASSAYTSNAGAVLSSSKDEYMLSLCGNRIWFVVELCEAIQAQKIDFANFELYSSSPQNFTVAVSKRFPTREWSNVGRFEAEDKRAVQSFDLHPHLFGKFVRVDINSHYSKEHYCTLSLFRVFGTSEFEAFETENHPNEDLDDFDDEYLLEQNTVKHAESNLFKSASDAVLSIVKKATEVLGKPASNQNQTFKTQPQSVVCRTPVSGLFNCADCPSTLVEKVNNVLTCEFSQLNVLLNNKGIRNDLLNTRVCAKLYGIETKQVLMPLRDMKQSFYVNILPNEYLGALCHVLAIPKEKPNTSFTQDGTQQNEATEMPTNLTMDKKFDKEDLNLLDHPEKKLLKPEIPTFPVDPKKPPLEHIETTTEANIDDNRQQLPRPLEPEDLTESTTLTPITKNIQKPTLPDTNIFNVPADDASSETEIPVASIETPTSSESIEQTTANATPPPVIVVTTPTPSAYIETTTAAASAKSEEDTNSWDNIEHLLTTVPSTVASPTGSAGITAPHSQQKISNGGPQSESVFIRLSNRIKALERNMSLSGQYLEELSRRYKKQVEELQQTLTQQMQTVRTLEEQNRRHHELEQMYALRNSQLKDELDDLTLQVHAFIVVIIFVGAFVFLVLMVGILFYRSLRRETKEVLALYEQGGKKKSETSTVVVGSTQKKLNRRKSFEDYSNHHQQSLASGGHDGTSVNRRPSEEAMLILKDCKDFDKTEELDPTVVIHSNPATGTTTRQRKISVCYSSNSNINQTTNAALPPLPPKSIFKRKGEKHSWPNSAHSQMQAWQHLEELNSEDHIGDSPDINPIRSKKPPSVVNGKTKKKKESQAIKRQQSSPVELSSQLHSSASGDLKGADYNERLMLDEDDLDNFIPNTDLAYNEFMPDGPRGYQCLNTASANANHPASKKSSNKETDNSSNLKKSARRLSSPVFFKSPFTKSLKGKITNSKSSSPAHESTSWEWYRLKKSASSASSSNGGGGGGTTTAPNNAYMRVTPNASLDSSSLSEINFPTNSTENSFRILEEAILSSGESAITTVTTTNSSNCKKSTDGISSGSNSNRSSSSNSSTQSKKKNRSFNKIFRKVF